MHITIFGGTKPRPGEPAYMEAVRLGAMLASAGHTVITGGYMGTMEAASRGANEAGGQVVGITCQEIENWRGGKANPWVTEEHKATTLPERMVMLMDSADAILALPGGIGTLAEISLFWNRMVIKASPRKPLVMIGAGWNEIIMALDTSLEGYFPSNYIEMVSFAGSVEEAVRLVESFQSSRA